MSADSLLHYTQSAVPSSAGSADWLAVIPLALFFVVIVCAAVGLAKLVDWIASGFDVQEDE